ncbi:MAG: hypothetical protein R3A79_05370 [Nannocystaceae bacterium]
MNASDIETIEQAVIDALVGIAPDIDPSEIEPGVDFCRDLDIDATDYKAFVADLHERFAIRPPAGDPPRLTTLDRCVEYIRTRQPG